MTSHGYATLSPNGPLVPFSFEIPEPDSFEVIVQITHCGLCHSDLDMIENNWGFSKYPLIAGHEIVGVIEKVGKKVTDLKIGDRVGAGWQCGSCLTCDICKKGFENLCSDIKETCVGRFGGFASHTIIDSRFAYKIPDSLPSELTAPLMCAGITVYQPMKYFGVRAGMKILVVGLGGLGHMAVKFGKSFGCEVSVLSSKSIKETFAKAIGVDYFYSNIDKVKRSSFDFILFSSPHDLSLDKYLELLKPLGKLCLVSIPNGILNLSPYGLIAGQKTVCGGSLGDQKSMHEMLEYCGQHKIVPAIKLLGLEKINEAITMLKNNEIEGRIVLEI